MLKNSYQVGYMDAPSCTLKITYNNGKVKLISDYGQKGTLGLQKLYKLFFNLRDTVAWEAS